MTTKIHEEGEGGGAGAAGATTTGSVGNTPGTDTGWGVNPPKKKIARRKVSMKEFLEINSSQVTESDATHIMTHDVMHRSGILARGTVLQKVHGSKKLYRVLAGRHAETIKSIDPEHVKPITEQELEEAIKGWKHAHSDIMKARADASAASNSVVLHQLRADGKESGMHDARKSFRTDDEARAHVENIKKLNPTRKYRYNKYVNGQHVGIVESEETEMSAVQEFFGIKSFDDVLCEGRKLTHIQVRPNSNTHPDHLGKIGQFGDKMDLSDDDQYNKAVADAHAYGKEKYGEGKYDLSHVDMRGGQNYAIRAGSVPKVRREMKKALGEEVSGEVITEASEYSFLSKSGFKKKGSVSDGGIVHSHPLHGDVIISKHGHWHHVPHGSTREDGFEGTTGNSLKDHLSRLSESDLHRSVSSGMKAKVAESVMESDDAAVKAEHKRLGDHASKLSNIARMAGKTARENRTKKNLQAAADAHHEAMEAHDAAHRFGAKHGIHSQNTQGWEHSVSSDSYRSAALRANESESVEGEIVESELHRAVSSGMKDLLHSGDHATFKKVAAHLGHPEWQTNPSESDLKSCSTPKLQKAHDHMYKGHPLGESVDMISEVEVQGADRYEYTHGKKPKGFGNWYFSKHKNIDFGAHKEGEDHVSIRGTYGEAKKQATAWAKSKGHAVIHVQT